MNGEHLPGKPLQLKFAAAGGTNKMFQNQGNGITRDEYANGYTMYIFDDSGSLYWRSLASYQKRKRLVRMPIWNGSGRRYKYRGAWRISESYRD